MRRTSIYRFGVAVTAMLMLGATSLTIAPFAFAQEDRLPMTSYRFGALGLTRGFTARLVAINTGFPPEPCRVELQFVLPDSILPPDPITPPDPVRPGQQAIAELRGNDIIPSDAPSGTRVEVAAVASIASPSYPPDPCVPSFQIVNDFTGITTAVGTPQAFPGNQ